MITAKPFIRLALLSMILCGLFISGCSSERVAPPIFTAIPNQQPLQQPKLLDVPKAPKPLATTITLSIPRQKPSVEPGKSVMRRGAMIKLGSSVLISFNNHQTQSTEQANAQESSGASATQPDGYADILEQYLERGLTASGFHVKDSSKFTERSTDIADIIRAAQDGNVMADYALQVIELDIAPYSGEPLQLSILPEVQEALRANPGLRLGVPGQYGVIPSTMKQPWYQARFNAKLIDVKTGSIDWMGEYSIESPAVLDDGIRILMGISKRPTNSNILIRELEDYNNTVKTAYEKASQAKDALDAEYKSALENKTYYGKSKDGESLQETRKRSVAEAEKRYAQALSEYQLALQQKPKDLSGNLKYEYDVDDPVVIPRFLQAKTDEENSQLLQHIKDLGAKVTYDLLRTIKFND